MLAHANATWMKSRERSFTNSQGQQVAFYRATILDEDYEPVELGCTLDMHEFAERELTPNTPVDLVLEVRATNNGIRTRIVSANVL